MANLQQLKLRKNSIQNIGKITNAMQLVATSKSAKAIAALEHSRNYYLESEKMLKKILEVSNSKLFDIKPSNYKEGTLWILISSDMGLCGSFNNQIFKLFDEQKKGKNDLYITVGSKAANYLKRKKIKIIDNFKISKGDLFEYISSRISKTIIDKIKEGSISDVKIIYTQFINQLNSMPIVFDLYPLSYENRIADKKVDTLKKNKIETKQLENELTEKKDIIKFIEFYINALINGFMNESTASEQVTRRVSMENATNNSKDLVDSLSIEYNRKRQSSITSQINEIVGGTQ